MDTRSRDPDRWGKSAQSVLTTIDIAIAAVYALALFALAQWVSRDAAGDRQDAQGYFLAGRALPWWRLRSHRVGRWRYHESPSLCIAQGMPHIGEWLPMSTMGWQWEQAWAARRARPGNGKCLELGCSLCVPRIFDDGATGECQRCDAEI